MSIKITADSTCDLSRECIEQYQIDIAPLYVVYDGKSYRDGLEITPDDIFRFVEEHGKVGSTAAVNVEDYRQFFAKNLSGHDGLVHFTISSDMSSCYQNACLAAQEFENVYVVDSRNLTTGIGLLVLDAAELAQSGMDAKEIFEAMEAKKERLNVAFVLNTLNYLKMGGRCSAVAALGANLLSLKPCIEVHDGAMSVGKKYRGNLENCWMKYVADRLSDPENIDTRRIFIVHSGISEEEIARIREAVARYVTFEEILIARAGCTISNHCGPNCMGIVFYRKG